MKKTSCTDIAIRFRKNKDNYHHFTVCCRGTLEACQEHEDLLTPKLEYDSTMKVSFADMKEIKTQTMQNLLQNLFDFPSPAQHQLPHAR